MEISSDVDMITSLKEVKRKIRQIRNNQWPLATDVMENVLLRKYLLHKGQYLLTSIDRDLEDRPLRGAIIVSNYFVHTLHTNRFGSVSPVPVQANLRRTYTHIYTHIDCPFF
jgi:hypothetical protein